MICFNIFRATQCTCCMLKSYLLQVLASLKQTSKWPWKWRPPGSLEIPSFEKPPFLRATVDGRNPAPLVMYETSQIMGHLPFQLVQDFLHQPYVRIFVSVVIGVYLLELPETPATNFRAARIDPVQQWPQRLSFDSLSFGDRFGPDSESVLCLREDFWKDSKTRKFQHLKSFGDELKALFLGWLVAFSQAPLSNLTGLKVGSSSRTACHEIQHSGRQTSQASKFQSTVRWGWTLGKLLIFVELCWADKVGPNFPPYKIGVMGPLLINGFENTSCFFLPTHGQVPVGMC